MIITLSVINDMAKLTAVQELAKALNWQDGRKTAGEVAQAVKRNEQAIMSDSSGQAMREAVLPHIVDHPVLRSATRPRRFSHLTVSKTLAGGFYGPHIDNALMGQGNARMRSDISFTLFISAPEDYDGGELVVRSQAGTQSIKLAAGQMVLYPSSSVHEVTPVTRGERLVCVGWIESLIEDPRQRELLFDLDKIRSAMRQNTDAMTKESLDLDKTIANLMRMWATV